jgi:hypothetical protein
MIYSKIRTYFSILPTFWALTSSSQILAQAIEIKGRCKRSLAVLDHRQIAVRDTTLMRLGPGGSQTPSFKRSSLRRRLNWRACLIVAHKSRDLFSHNLGNQNARNGWNRAPKRDATVCFNNYSLRRRREAAMEDQIELTFGRNFSKGDHGAVRISGYWLPRRRHGGMMTPRTRRFSAPRRTFCNHACWNHLQPNLNATE